MKAENYLNVVEKLNNELYEVGIDLFEIRFEYLSTYYIDIVNFMGIQVFNSEVDCEIETEEQLEGSIREKVLKITNILCKWQKTNNYIISVDLAKDTALQFAQEYDYDWVGEENK